MRGEREGNERPNVDLEKNGGKKCQIEMGRAFLPLRLLFFYTAFLFSFSFFLVLPFVYIFV